MTKKLFNRFFTDKLPRRVISLLMAAVMVALMFPAFEIHTHALGGFSEYEIDGKTYFVQWDDDEFGAGMAYMECDYCSHQKGCHFSDFDCESAAESIISELFPYDCNHCEWCIGEQHCTGCGGCFESGDVDMCEDCGSLYCLACHDSDNFCDICDSCLLEQNDHESAIQNGVRGTLSGYHLCWDCYEDQEVCANCDAIITLGGGAVNLMDENGFDWCEDCMLCGECLEDPAVLAEYGHCISCGECGTACPDCFLCSDCAYGVTHCPDCDYCFGEDGEVEWCPDGGEHCVNCDEDNDWICEQCGSCLEVTGKEKCDDCGLCLDCCLENSENEGCIHGYCIESADYYDHVCLSCGLCPEDTECDYCGFCEDCQEDYHCEHGLCPDDSIYDEHLCESCGDCFEEDELCELCHMCEDCWEHCEHDICPEDSDYEDHICVFCGDCFEEDEICEYCHMCENCWEHCEHDICPEDSDYEDHICEQCGDCYEEDEFCDECGLCVYCCLDNTESMGCDHELCVESSEFEEHYCYVDEQCLEYCNHKDCDHDHVDTKWSNNEKSHWKTCLDCGLSVDCGLHTEGAPVVTKEPNPVTKTNGVAKISCATCGQHLRTVKIPYDTYTATDKPQIFTQPEDYTGKVSSVLYDPLKVRYATFTVSAYGADLKYQWYMTLNTNAPEKLLDGCDNDFYYDFSGRQDVSGATTNKLTIVVPSDACNQDYVVYCVISNKNGSVTTRKAKIDAQHYYVKAYIATGNSYHENYCMGDGCDEHYTEEHRYGAWEITKEPTLTAPGLKKRVCSDCGYVYTTQVAKLSPAHEHKYNQIKYGETTHWYECECGVKDASTVTDHSFGSWTVTKQPTTKSEGLRKRWCKTCGYAQTEVLDKLPHTHDFTTLKRKNLGRYVVPNGKVDDNYHYVFCTECQTYEKNAHVYGDWTRLHKSYQDENNVWHYAEYIHTCLICGHTETTTSYRQYPVIVQVADSLELAKDGHYGAQLSYPVRADAGQKIYIGALLEEGYTLSGTSWSLNEVSSSDGIREDGQWLSYKNRDIKDFTVSKSGRDFIGASFTMPDGPVAILLIPGECDHKGCGTYQSTDNVNSCIGYSTTAERCNGCKTILRELDRREPLGHNWSPNFVTITQGTCTTRSRIKETCTRCGEERIKNGGYAHHYVSRNNRVEPSCQKMGHAADQYCTNCGKEKPGKKYPAIGSHNWGEWVTIKEASTTQKGKEQHTCLRCGITKSITVDYTGPDYKLKADKNTLNFDVVYGQSAGTQTVKVESYGRNEITEINDYNDSVIYGYTVKFPDKMTAEITPDLTWMIMSDEANKTEELKLYASETDLEDNRVYASVSLNTNIRFPSGKFKLSAKNATFSILNKATNEFEPYKRTEHNVQAGSIIRVVANDDINVLNKWAVDDSSGLIESWFNDSGNKDKKTAYFVMPPNDVSIEAVDKIVNKIDLTGLVEPVIGNKPFYGVSVPSGANYSVDNVNWFCNSYGIMDSDAVFEEGETYYAEILIAPKDGVEFNPNYVMQSVTINGKEELVDLGWTKYYRNGKWMYRIITVDFTPKEAVEPTTEPEVTEPTEATTTPVVTEPTEEAPTTTPGVTEPTEEAPTTTPGVTEPTEDVPTTTPDVTEPTEEAPTTTPDVTEPTEVPGEEPDGPTEPTEPEPTDPQNPDDPIEEFILGDVNGDGKVDAKDRIMLTRYLAHWAGYETINEKAADINKDGKVDAKDRIILTRHLAKWQGYESF